MNDEKSHSCEMNEPQMVTISGTQIDLAHIKQILLSHEAVQESTITILPGGGEDSLLQADVVLNKDHSPSNELKLELAWHVGIESGLFSVFKDIRFCTTPDCEIMGLVEPRHTSGIVHISGHGINTVEVEDALMAFNGVAHARVIGVPDKRKGELLKAFITLKQGIIPSNDLKTELAWHVRIGTHPQIVFKEIVFGDFGHPEEPTVSESLGGTEVEGSPHQLVSDQDSDGMVIVDEVKEDGNVIHISSHKISTNEITRSLLDHPYVSDAAVVTIPNDKRGETMKAFVKLMEGVAPSNDLKLELAWHVMTDLKPISVFKSIDMESSMPEATIGTSEISIEASIEHGIKENIGGLGQTEDLSRTVETILAAHGSVSEAIVIAVKDQVHGQALQAFVTLNKGFQPTEGLMEELAWHARTEIGPSVVFKSIKFRRFFPVTKSRETLESLLKADAMEIPTMMSITIAD